MVAHIANARRFGVPVVVAVNRFTTDTDAEIELVRKAAVAAGAEDAVMSDHWAEGGAGAVALAKAVIAACEKPVDFKFLYPLEWDIKKKIETIATQIYGADGVDYTPEAEAKIALYTRLGFDKLPICMAKTHLSLSHDPALKGRPQGLHAPRPRHPGQRRRRVPLSALRRHADHARPADPAGRIYDVDIDLETGKVTGLF